MSENIDFPFWFKKGIKVIGDIISINKQVLNKEEIKEKFNMKINNFLEYYQLKQLIQKMFKENNLLLTKNS